MTAFPQCTAFNRPIPAASYNVGSEPSGHRLSPGVHTPRSSANLSQNPSRSWAPLSIINLSQGDKHIPQFLKPGVASLLVRRDSCVYNLHQ